MPDRASSGRFPLGHPVPVGEVLLPEILHIVEPGGHKPKSERQQQNKRKAHRQLGRGDISPEVLCPLLSRRAGNPRWAARRWLRQARSQLLGCQERPAQERQRVGVLQMLPVCQAGSHRGRLCCAQGKSDGAVKPTALAQKIEEYSQQLEGLTNDVHTLEAYGVDSLSQVP